MSTTLCASHCACKQLVTKINLLKPADVEVLSGFMRDTVGTCSKQSSDYWDMRTVSINWGSSSELHRVHRIAVDSIIQEVSEDLPF